MSTNLDNLVKKWTNNEKMSGYFEKSALAEELLNLAIAGKDKIKISSVINMIECLPAADVVEVVRCKDCAYSDPDCLCSGEVMYKCGYNSDPCLLLNGNHFCSNGRKLKDGKNND